jgi:hypothetical protein
MICEEIGMKKVFMTSVLAAAISSAAWAGAPDWNKVQGRTITVFYPGVSPIEWVTKGTAHGGARMLKKGETCAGCHDEEAADMGLKMVKGLKNEPTPPAGKAPAIPVTVQAAYDDNQLYLRFSWKQPETSGSLKMDAKNTVKLAVMFDDNKVEMASQSGCWQACHEDVRTMPGAKDEKKTKYIKDGNVATGVYYDVMQWLSHDKAIDGHVADARVMSGGTALVSAVGKNNGGQWDVVFTRKLKGGAGDIAMVAGQKYNFGFAIHDDHAGGRFHHVSLGYTLGLGVDADLKANK